MKLAWAAVLAFATGASAQVGVLYRVVSPATLRLDHCLGPCLCLHFFETGALWGTFTLAFDQPGPVFTQYTVTGVSFRAVVGKHVVTVSGSGVYATTGASQDMHLVLSASSPQWPTAEPYVSGLVTAQEPFPRIGVTITGPLQGCNRNSISIIAEPVPCQADCDASGSLTANDFMCFLDKFVSGDPYANCDGSTSSPRLNAIDFQCYLGRFAAGCP